MIAAGASRKALERKITAAAMVREWKRRSKGNRCSVAKLASDLGLTRRMTEGLIKLRPKQLDAVREKLKVVREVARRVRAPRRSRDTAPKVATDLKIKHVTVRSVRTLRRPYRAKVLAIRKANVQENRRLTALYEGESPSRIASQAAMQGW